MPSARPPDLPPEPSWSGWGDPAEASELSDGLSQLLTQALGIRRPGRRVGPLSALAPPPSRIPATVRAALESLLGAAHVLDDDEARIRHLRGKSTPDLLRLRAGDLADAPDLVLLPASHDEVLDTLRICSRELVAVVPFGGGTSVVGGLEPRSDDFTGQIALDLRRLNRLQALDEVSRVAVLEPGLRGPEAEALLGEHGFITGHYPQSFEYATIGGYAATRSSGQSSVGYGRFDEHVVGLRVATPTGELALGRAPKSAAGPDLRQLILGSEGALGVITAVSLEVRPAPAVRAYEGWRFESFAAGAAVVRRLAQDGPRPTVLRLSDEAETALNLARPAEIGAPGASCGCLAIVGFEGTAEDVAGRRREVTRVLEAAATGPEPDAGESWVRDRYHGPYLRDALLDAGALVETLETVTFWSSLPELYAAVSGALRDSLSAQGTPPVILCHISHVYPSGASLYFTVGCAALEDPLVQWRQAKAAASDAILAAGGSITHHHGVGRDHRDWYERELGRTAVRALRAVKAELDPQGILNPGILIP
ncbi:MAG TPA: FAD-binding oxidoreductase [Solirubrobacteraceae bacterium]|nr:FAD-binding oxidoreductase [Solirubrobacteraceae bacterium]